MRLQDERVDAVLGIEDVVPVERVEDVLPARVLEAGKAERFVEGAVIADGEIGAEHDTDPAADVVEASFRPRRPRLAQQAAARGVERPRRHGQRQADDGKGAARAKGEGAD